MTSKPAILTLEQAAEFLQVSKRTLQRIVKKGEVPGVLIGGQWRFDRQQLLDLVRGEWIPPVEKETGRKLVEAESLRLGVEIPEAFHDLQKSAAKRMLDSEESQADEGENAG
jgi:excisionase family DNA binding protein